MIHRQKWWSNQNRTKKKEKTSLTLHSLVQFLTIFLFSKVVHETNFSTFFLYQSFTYQNGEVSVNIGFVLINNTVCNSSVTLIFSMATSWHLYCRTPLIKPFLTEFVYLRLNYGKKNIIFFGMYMKYITSTWFVS